MGGGKKAIILVVALAFVALAFTGCLGSSNSGDTTNSGTNDNPSLFHHARNLFNSSMDEMGG